MPNSLPTKLKCPVSYLIDCMFPFFFLPPLRIFSFDERQNKFLLLAQSQYLKRCVLTVSHVIDFRTSDKPLVMLFAGDTAGKISCWDVTALLLNHIREHCICGEDKLITNKSEKESGDHTTVQTLAVHDEETVNKASGRKRFEGDVSSERCDRAQESVTAWHAEENVTADSVKAVEHAKNSDTKTSSHWCCKDGVAQDCVTGGCQASESVTNTEKHLTERTKFADVNPLAANQDPFHCGQEVLNVANTKEQTAITCETPDLTDPDDQEFSAMDQSDFSCLPLVPVFLDLPAHVFDAHQSGVNAISLVKTQGRAKQSKVYKLFTWSQSD